MFNHGISRSGGVLDLATDKGLVSKTGTWFTYADQRLGQGRENAKAFLESNPEVMAELEKQIRGDRKEEPVAVEN
jgi:recombination protein RecA